MPDPIKSLVTNYIRISTDFRSLYHHCVCFLLGNISIVVRIGVVLIKETMDFLKDFNSII